MTTDTPVPAPHDVLAAFERHRRAAALLGAVIDDSLAQALKLDCDSADRLVAALGLMRQWPSALAVTVAHASQDAERGLERHAWLHGNDDGLRRHLGAVTTAALIDDDPDRG